MEERLKGKSAESNFSSGNFRGKSIEMKLNTWHKIILIIE